MEAKNHSYRPNDTKKTCFVGGITIFITREDIERYFSKFGPIKSVDFPKKKKKRLAKGFCLVQFGSRRGYERVLAKEEHTLKSLTLRVKSCIDPEQAKSIVLKKQARKLFVANLPLDTSEKQIKNLMSKFGAVEEVTMQHKFVDQKKVFKGYAFVLMADQIGYSRGLEAGELYILDRRVEIKTALPKGKKSETKITKLEPQAPIQKTADHKSSESSPEQAINYCFRLAGSSRQEKNWMADQRLIREINRSENYKGEMEIYSLKRIDDSRLNLLTSMLNVIEFKGRHTIVLKEKERLQRGLQQSRIRNFNLRNRVDSGLGDFAVRGM